MSGDTVRKARKPGRRPRPAAVKGCEAMLTLGELSVLLGVPERRVREGFLSAVPRPGKMRGMKLGGNCWRVTRREYERWCAEGATGFNHVPGSGQHMKEGGGAG